MADGAVSIKNAAQFIDFLHFEDFFRILEIEAIGVRICGSTPRRYDQCFSSFDINIVGSRNIDFNINLKRDLCYG